MNDNPQKIETIWHEFLMDFHYIFNSFAYIIDWFFCLRYVTEKNMLSTSCYIHRQHHDIVSIFAERINFESENKIIFINSMSQRVLVSVVCFFFFKFFQHTRGEILCAENKPHRK